MESYPPFGDFEPQYTRFETAQIVILPVSYDQTSTWVKGADQGPPAILKASRNLEFYDIFTNSEVFRKGIFTDVPAEGFSTPEAMVEHVRRRMLGYFQKNKFPVVLGGEHSVSIGAIQAAAMAFPNLTILQLDAHADLRAEYEGSAFNHACVMARAKECGPIVQAGIRSMDTCEQSALDRSRVFFAHEIAADTQQGWIGKLLSLLTENVYLTIDLDVFDPSIMPATGTPEPGGLGWYEVISLIEQLCRSRKLIGMDVVELCPREPFWACDFLAAKLIYQTLSFRFQE